MEEVVIKGANIVKENNKRLKLALRYRWIIWSVLALCYAIVFFHRLSVGVIREDLIHDFGISNVTFANLGAVYFYVYMLMQIPAGMLADTLGARKTVVAGTLIAGIGSVIFGIAPHIGIAFIGRFLVGVGVSIIFVPILTVQSKWFYEREFGTMTGLTSFIGNLGGVVAQTPLAFLVSISSWRITFIEIGGFSILLGIVCFLIVKNTPEEMGFPPLNTPKHSIKDKKNLILKKVLVSVLKNKNTWAPFTVFAGVFGSYVAFTGTWGRAYLVDVYGVEKISAANYTFVAALALALGCIIIGKLSDKIKKRKIPAMICGIANLLCWVIMVFEGKRISLVGLMIILCIMGLSCSVVVLCFAVAKEINFPEFVGVSTSVVNMGGFAGAALIPVLIGLYFDKFGNVLQPAILYKQGFIICIVASTIGLIATVMMKETHCENISEQ